jgi:hydrogenase expression/formation protein HypD
VKYLDEFRDPRLASQLVDEIRLSATRRWVLMDVCGGQTHSLLRHGIEEALMESVELIHGPGCPVCVTPPEDIDLAHALSMQEGVTLTTFGDMLRVPGSHGSLMQARTGGGSVQTVYAPVDAVRLAQENPDQHFVFFAVGFETTAPATALAVLQADQLGLHNFSLLVSHVRVLPAMESLMLAEDNRVQAFLAAGHVCTVTGYEQYEAFAQRFGVPVVIAGFEPIDLLLAIRQSVRLLEAKDFRVVNCYARSARFSGNAAAQSVLDRVYRTADSNWRGFGRLPDAGLELHPSLDRFNARKRFSRIPTLPVVENPRCRSADVLAGRIKPIECSEFGKHCHPDAPLGAPMVSSEGACAAYMRYAHISNNDHRLSSTAAGSPSPTLQAGEINR